MKNVTIYTDGACSFNPGPGGWGAVLMFKGHSKEISGFNAQTTNNRMELTAVIESLKLLKEQCVVDLYSDSAYVVNAFQQDWISSWILKGWRTAGKKEVQNVDLWQTLVSLSNHHKITWHKVKGHSDNEFNNRCDELARKEIEKVMKQPNQNKKKLPPE